MHLTAEQIKQVIRERIPDGLVVPEHTHTGHFYRHMPTNTVCASVTTKCGILDAPHLKKYAANRAVQHLDKHWNEITDENRHEFFKAAVMAHEDEFHDAGDVGTQGHGIIETYLKTWMRDGKRPDDIRTFVTEQDIRLMAITRSAEMFCRDFNVEPIASELFVCSIRHRFAGTLDSLMLVSRTLEKGTDPACNHEWWSSPSKMFHETCLKCNEKIVKEFALVDWKTSNSIDKVEYAMQVSAYWWAFFEMTGLRPKHIFIVRLDKKYAKYEAVRVVSRPRAFAAFKSASKLYDWLNDGEEKLCPLRPKNIMTINYEHLNAGTA